MKSYVIAITNLEESMDAARRCIESGKKFGVDIEVFPAITPKDEPYQILKEEGLNTVGFQEKYSRTLNCISAFLSHYSLWNKCVKENVPFNIFEHDAILFDRIPEVNYNYVINWGAPSYGNFNIPNHIGVGPLTTKNYFPGAHAYGVKPEGAKKLIKQAKVQTQPTDIFLNKTVFPWLQEHYPFIAEARDSFTTIQNELGCHAKHNYKKGYRIVSPT